MWLGDLSSPCLIPNIQTNEDVIFKFNNDLLTSSQNFKISFLYKTLGVNFKLVTLNDLILIININIIINIKLKILDLLEIILKKLNLENGNQKVNY